MSAELVRRGLSEEIMKRYGDPYDYTHPMNQKTGQRDQVRSVWGFGGYYCNAIDTALRHDDADGFVELMRAAQLDAAAETFDGLTMAKYCEKRGAEKCKEALHLLQAQQKIRELAAALKGRS